MPRPSLPSDSATLAEFDRLYDAVIASGDGAPIDYQLSAPKWQFLSYLGDRKGILFHGSNDGAIEEFEPRKANDVDDFGDQKAVYAASDPLWAMYFAILDNCFPIFKVNAAIRLALPYGPASEPFYFFSVSRPIVEQRAFRSGALYLLPAGTFEQQPRFQAGEQEIISLQWRSFVPIRPLARIPIDPEDFPFLSQIRGHDDTVLKERMQQDPGGFPWLPEDEW